VEKQGNIEDGFVSGMRLNYLIVFVVGSDIGFWFFGFITLCVSQSALCANRVTMDTVSLVCYQFFNIFMFSAYLDIIIPYFHLEVSITHTHHVSLLIQHPKIKPSSSHHFQHTTHTFPLTLKTSSTLMWMSTWRGLRTRQEMQRGR